MIESKNLSFLDDPRDLVLQEHAAWDSQIMPPPSVEWFDEVKARLEEFIPAVNAGWLAFFVVMQSVAVTSSIPTHTANRGIVLLLEKLESFARNTGSKLIDRDS